MLKLFVIFVLLLVVVSVAVAADKIEICHMGKTIEISANAWPAHEAHGDYLGQCRPESPAEPEPPGPAPQQMYLYYLPIVENTCVWPYDYYCHGTFGLDG